MYDVLPLCIRCYLTSNDGAVPLATPNPCAGIKNPRRCRKTYLPHPSSARPGSRSAEHHHPRHLHLATYSTALDTRRSCTHNNWPATTLSDTPRHPAFSLGWALNITSPSSLRWHSTLHRLPLSTTATPWSPDFCDTPGHQHARTSRLSGSSTYLTTGHHARLGIFQHFCPSWIFRSTVQAVASAEDGPGSRTPMRRVRRPAHY